MAEAAPVLYLPTLEGALVNYTDRSLHREGALHQESVNASSTLNVPLAMNGLT